MLLWSAPSNPIPIWLAFLVCCYAIWLCLCEVINTYFIFFLISFLNITWYALCRLFLGRRWLPQSLHFLILQHKFVMQFKLGQSKVLNNSSLFMLLVIISVFVIWPISFSPPSFWGPDKYHGVILLPEGLIESIPEIYALLKVTGSSN